MYYLGTVLLRMSEKEFWHTTPRKLIALANQHIKLNGGGEEKEEDAAMALASW